MKYQTFSREQKLSIIKQVESAKDKRRELIKLGIPRSTYYYDWKKVKGETKKKTPHWIWNKTPEKIEIKIKEYRTSHDPLKQSPARILENPERNEGYIMSESGVKSVLVRQKRFLLVVSTGAAI